MSLRNQIQLIAYPDRLGSNLADLHTVIDRHFPLENLADAFRHQAANAHFGKIVVDI